MKINKFITAIIIGAICLSACEDFLDTDSPSQFDAGYLFSNEEDAKSVLLGAYQPFCEDPFTSRMSNAWAQNTDVECIAPSEFPDGSRRDIWSLQGGLLEGWGDIKKAWDNNYLAIDRANQVIEGILQSDIRSTDNMKHMLGEAHTLRAYRYWMLCTMWADVPYFRESAKAGIDLDPGKTDKNIIFTSEIQDLIDHEENMMFSDVAPGGIERMNRDFALGMICRLALYRAGYGMTQDGTMKRADDYLTVTDDNLTVTYKDENGTEIKASTSEDYYRVAKFYAQKLISLKGRQLNSNYKYIFERQCQFSVVPNDESLFEVAFTEGNGGDVAWCIGQAVTASSKGSTTIQVQLSPAYYFSFDDKDIRRDVTCTRVKYTKDNYEEVNGITGICVGKWSRMLLTSDPGKESSKGTGVNWTLMRYSDVLLMLAEAENALNGPTALAKEQLKKVRSRAFDAAAYTEKVENYVNNLSTQDDFFSAIVNERAWEFGGEALRKYDLARWNIYGEKINESIKFLTKLGRATVADLVINEPDLEPYTKYAKYLYWRRVDGKIQFYNDIYRPSDEEQITVIEDGDQDKEGNDQPLIYVRSSWASSLVTEIKDTVDGVEVSRNPKEYRPANFILWCYRGYTGKPNMSDYEGNNGYYPSGNGTVPYLLPIGTETIGNSNTLNNNGYGHVKSY